MRRDLGADHFEGRKASPTFEGIVVEATRAYAGRVPGMDGEVFYIPGVGRRWDRPDRASTAGGPIVRRVVIRMNSPAAIPVGVKTKNAAKVIEIASGSPSCRLPSSPPTSPMRRRGLPGTPALRLAGPRGAGRLGTPHPLGTSRDGLRHRRGQDGAATPPGNGHRPCHPGGCPDGPDSWGDTPRSGRRHPARHRRGGGGRLGWCSSSIPRGRRGGPRPRALRRSASRPGRRQLVRIPPKPYPRPRYQVIHRSKERSLPRHLGVGTGIACPRLRSERLSGEALRGSPDRLRVLYSGLDPLGPGIRPG